MKESILFRSVIWALGFGLLGALIRGYFDIEHIDWGMRLLRLMDYTAGVCFAIFVLQLKSSE